jgi:hypothetical protein
LGDARLNLVLAMLGVQLRKHHNQMPAIEKKAHQNHQQDDRNEVWCEIPNRYQLLMYD